MDMDLEKFMIQVSILNTLKCFGFIFFVQKVNKCIYNLRKHYLIKLIVLYIFFDYCKVCTLENNTNLNQAKCR